MAGFLQSLLADYQNQMQRHQNRPFLNAAMAACALMSGSGGEITFSQRVRVDQILETLEKLQIFDPHEAINLFNDYAQAILDNPRDGHARALAAVQAVTSAEVSEGGTAGETASLLVRICMAVAQAGGERNLSQEIEIVMLCSLLEVEPENTDLYIHRDEFAPQ
jgi:tellurite resistance protein TerB